MPTTQLHHLIDNQQWVQARERLRTEEGNHEAATTDDDGNLPLHLIFGNSGPLEVVSALLLTYPEGARIINYFGDLPLHLACKRNTPVEVVDELISAFEDGTKATNYFGDLPIHLVCKQQAHLEVVKRLLKAHPDGAQATNYYGNIPLHEACRWDAPSDIVLALLNTSRHGAKTTNKYHKLPLHYACGRRASFQVVQILLREYPQGSLTADRGGALPLDYLWSHNEDNGCELNHRVSRFRFRVQELQSRLHSSPLLHRERQKELHMHLLENHDEDLYKMIQKSGAILRAMHVSVGVEGLNEAIVLDHDNSCRKKQWPFVFHAMANMSCHVHTVLWKLCVLIHFGVNVTCSGGKAASANRQGQRHIQHLLLRDDLGCTPLHYAAKCKLCELVGTQHKCGISTHSFKAGTPTEEARQFAMVIFRDLLRLAPEAARVRDNDGQLPLALALENPSHVFCWHGRPCTTSELSTHRSNFSVNYVPHYEVDGVMNDPEMNRMDSGRDSENGLGLMQELVRLSPQCLYAPDEKTGLFPFMMAAMKREKHSTSEQDQVQAEKRGGDIDSVTVELEKLVLAYELLKKHPVFLS